MKNPKVVPLTSDPNQKFNIVIEVDGVNRYFTLSFSYRDIPAYWTMDVSEDNMPVLSNIPLIPGIDVLEKFRYKDLGSAVLVKLSDSADDYPTGSNLSSDFALLWGSVDEK